MVFVHHCNMTASNLSYVCVLPSASDKDRWDGMKFGFFGLVCMNCIQLFSYVYILSKKLNIARK